MIKKILIFFFIINICSTSQSEIIKLIGCNNGRDGFKKNDYTLDLEKSLMTRDFIYDSKTYKKYRLTDIKTKKENSINRFIYKEGDVIFSDKVGYPQFYTQLMFEKNNLAVKIKTVINGESAIANLSKCKKINIYQSES